jgi:VCBS repeat-containing protein
MADENTPNSQAEVTSDAGATPSSQATPSVSPSPVPGNVVVLTTPDAGQTQSVTLSANDVIRMDFDINNQTVELNGDNLRIEFENGAVIVLEDFAALAEQGSAPLLSMEDGSMIPGDILLTALTEEPDVVAAGEAPASGGSSQYGDDLGGILDGIGRLGVLDPDQLASSQQQPIEDEQAAPEVAALVTPENNPPDAVDDHYVIPISSENLDEAIKALKSILSNDSDPDGDNITITEFKLSPEVEEKIDPDQSDGSLALKGGYTPEDLIEAYRALGEGEESDPITFQYTISDPSGASDTATVSIVFVGVNDLPVAQDDSYVADSEDDATAVAAASGILNHDDATDDPTGDDYDPDTNDTISVATVEGSAANIGSWVDLAGGGQVKVNADGSFDFNPDGDFNSLAQGVEGSTSFDYTIVDNNGDGSNTATVTINVTGENDAPVAQDDSYAADSEDDPTGVAAASGILNHDDTTDDPAGDDYDPDTGDTISVATVEGSAANIGNWVDLASGGQVKVNADGSFDFNPDGDFNSLGVGDQGSTSFDYTIVDNNGTTSNTATVTINVAGENDPPDAIDNSYSSTLETGSANIVLMVDTSGSMGDSVAPGQSRLDLTKDAVENLINTYGSALNKVMVVEFNASASVLQNGANETWMTGSEAIDSINTLTDGGVTDYDSAIAAVEANYGTPPSVDNTFMYFLSDGVPVGSDSGNPNTISASERADWVSFLESNSIDEVYAVGIGPGISPSDQDLQDVAWSSTGDHDSNVTLVADEQDLSGTLETLASTVHGNVITDNTGEGLDSDPESDPLTLTHIDGAVLGADPIVLTKGTLTIDSDGDFSFVPNKDASGDQTFTYTITDGNGGSDTATVTISIPDANDPPVVGNDQALLSEEGLDSATIGNPDALGSADTTNATSVTNGSIPVSDADNNALTLTLSTAAALYSGGVELTWDGDGTLTDPLVGSANGSDILSVQIDNDGNYDVTLSGPLDHSTAGDASTDAARTSAEDQLSFDVTVHASDGKTSSTGTLNIVVEDDSPLIGDGAEDSTLNMLLDPADSITADLDFAFGGDGPAATESLWISGANGSALSEGDTVVDNGGNTLTANGINLVYAYDDNGDLTAVMDPTASGEDSYNADHIAFRVAMDADAETYTVSIEDGLDGAPVSTTIGLNDGTFGNGGGNTGTVQTELDFDSDGSNDTIITATATDADGNATTVNYNSLAMGVSHGDKINGNGPTDSETLNLTFTESGGDYKLLSSAEASFWHLDSGETGYWVAIRHNADGSIAEQSTPVAFDLSDLDADGNLTIDPSFQFDSVQFTESGRTGYGVASLTVTETSEGNDFTISFDYAVTDGDGDSYNTLVSEDPNDGFDVTFDGTPDLTDLNNFNNGSDDNFAN